MEKERRRVPNAPKFAGERVLMPYNGRYAREGELQIGHVNAALVYVARVNETVSGIVDTAGLQDVQSGDEHSASSAARIVDGDNAVARRFFFYESFVHDARHKFRDMVRSKKLSGVLVAEIAFHEQLAEIVVEFAVVVDDGGEQSVNLAENLRKFLLQGWRIAFDDLQIPLFTFLFLCEVDLIGNCDGAALEQVRNEFAFIHLIGGAFDVFYDIVKFRDRVRAEFFLFFRRNVE